MSGAVRGLKRVEKLAFVGSGALIHSSQNIYGLFESWCWWLRQQCTTLLNRQRSVRALVKEILVNEPVHRVDVVFWKDEGQESNRALEVGT